MPDYRIVDIKSMYEKTLYKSLAIPSSIHSYSLCIQYIRNWFLSKFPAEYFKTVHIDGKHIFDDFRVLNRTNMLKREKPALAIVPQLVFDYNRERVDQALSGIDLFVRRSKYQDAFYKDSANDTYLGIVMEAIQMNFTFKMKFSTRAQQVDAYKFIQMAHRVGATQGEYINMDFHVPYDLMVQIAKDCKFDIDEDGKIVNVIKFLGHLNKNSQIPFLYKFRCINGRDEFFIKVPDLYVHISVPDLNADDGDREGQLQTNYMVEMNATVTFPCPKYYIYFTEKYIDQFILGESADDFISMYTIGLTDVPKENEQKWDQYLTTQYEELDRTKPLEIDFTGLFKGTELGEIIDYTKSVFISPRSFMEIKLFNDRKEQPMTMDWETLTLTTKEKMVDDISYISIYLDKKYFNETLIALKEYKKSRL